MKPQTPSYVVSRLTNNYIGSPDGMEDGRYMRRNKNSHGGVGNMANGGDMGIPGYVS